MQNTGIEANETFVEVMFGGGVMLGLISYIFGGLLTAIKMAWKIGKWGWFVVPFPWDLVAFPCTFLLGLVIFVMLLIIPIRKAYKEKMASEEALGLK